MPIWVVLHAADPMNFTAPRSWPQKPLPGVSQVLESYSCSGDTKELPPLLRTCSLSPVHFPFGLRSSWKKPCLPPNAGHMVAPALPVSPFWHQASNCWSWHFLSLVCAMPLTACEPRPGAGCSNHSGPATLQGAGWPGQTAVPSTGAQVRPACATPGQLHHCPSRKK